MVAKFLFACLCSLLVIIGQGQSRRVISMVDLKPAEIIEHHNNPPKAEPMLGSIFKNCSMTSDKFQLTNVLIQGCSSSPCILKKGTEAQVEIDFEAHEVTPNITAKVFGQIDGIKVPFPITQPDACKCGITCPTKIGTPYKYKYSLPVLEEYPSVTCVVFWYLYDAQNDEAVCMDVLVKITS